MSLKIFKPNSRGTGALFTFEFGPSSREESFDGELSLFVSSVLQGAWNATSKTASFKENAKNPEKTFSAKFTEFEIGGFINAIKRRVEFKAYHSTEKAKTAFSFAPSKDEAGELRGFFFSVIRDNKAKFCVPINTAEAETLLAYLDWGLKILFSNRWKARRNRSTTAQAQTRQPAPVEEAAPVQQEEADPFKDEAQPVAEEVQETPPVDENPFG